jgi:WD40-like Beta Propeller Repeat/Tetratricopeptide repeat
MKHILRISLALFLMLPFVAGAQSVVTKSADEVKLFAASQAFNGGDYVKALNLYKEVLANNPNDPSVIFHIGTCYFEMGETDQALTQFEKAKGINPDGHPDLRLMLGRIYQMQGKLDEAITELTVAKSKTSSSPAKSKEVAYYLNQCQTAKTLMASPKKVAVTNPGTLINSAYDDKRPSITADGKTMIFNSRRPGGKTSEKDREGDNKYFEDIYMCAWDSAGMKWGAADLASGAINTDGHDAACSISPDGKQLFIYVNNAEKARGGDIYTSKRNNSGKWSNPKNMGVNINTSYFEDGAVLSPDGNTMYFMSERGQDMAWKGQRGYGRSDIWMCKRKSKSEWDVPVNLGPVVNTEYDEGGIFPAPDGKTLYFCSNGHNSMGGYDIFMTRFENGVWSTPVNVGYPINTPGNERMFQLSADGKTAYVDSDRPGGLGERDIWMVDMTELMPKKKEGPVMSTLLGSIYNGDGLSVAAEVKVFDVNGTQIGTATSTPQGNYSLNLEGDRTYEIRVEMPGYKAVKETISLPADKEGGTFELVKHFIIYKE